MKKTSRGFRDFVLVVFFILAVGILSAVALALIASIFGR
jgi:hypothetical protein